MFLGVPAHKKSDGKNSGGGIAKKSTVPENKNASDLG
jgi:hypothetical protein